MFFQVFVAAMERVVVPPSATWWKAIQETEQAVKSARQEVANGQAKLKAKLKAPTMSAGPQFSPDVEALLQSPTLAPLFADSVDDEDPSGSHDGVLRFVKGVLDAKSSKTVMPQLQEGLQVLSGELGGDSSLSSSSTVGALLSVSAVAAPAKVLRRHRAHSSAEDWPVTKEDHELRRRLALEAQEEQARNEGRPLPKKTSKRRSVW